MQPKLEQGVVIIHDTTSSQLVAANLGTQPQS